MDHDPPNPYAYADLRSLNHRAMEVARALKAGDKVGRQDVFHLLVMLGMRIDPQAYATGSPRHQVDKTGAAIADVFFEQYLTEAAVVRGRTLSQAVDAAGLPPQAINAYLRAGRSDGATTSDERLLAALQDLDRRRADPPPTSG